MLAASRILFLIAFASYLSGSIAYISGVIGVRSARTRTAVAAATSGGTATAAVPAPAFSRWPQWGFYFVAAGAALQLGGIVTRWIGAGYYPISNMYEFMNFFGWAIMLFYLWIGRQYNVPALGAFVAPLGMLILAYASVFPKDIQPLIPALQSYWLVLHVSTAALGEGAFAVSFGAALMYLLWAQKTDEVGAWGRGFLEFTLFCVLSLGVFIGLALVFGMQRYSVAVPGGAAYTLPPLVGPAGVDGSLANFAGMSLPLFSAPTWMAGVNAAQKLNTLFVTALVSLVIYGLIRLVRRQPLRVPASKYVANLNPDVLDDISYKGIALGFPLFTLGGLLFAMIWAQEAWGRFWGWDPKEVWALIMWLVYSGYLHLRMTRGWRGAKAAWLALIGFVVVMFTLLGVNLLIVGLHSYAV